MGGPDEQGLYNTRGCVAGELVELPSMATEMKGNHLTVLTEICFQTTALRMVRLISCHFPFDATRGTKK